MASVVRSHSGRFYVLAADPVLRTVLVRWAEDVAGRVGRLTGVGPEFGDAIVRLVVRDRPDRAEGGLSLTRVVMGMRVVEQLTIEDYDQVEREDADEALCGILLRVYAQPWRRGQPTEVSVIPAWLSLGLAQNLYPALRERNSRLALSRWEEGKLATVVEFLGRDAATQRLDKEACGLFVGWLLSLPDRNERFEALLRRLAADGEADAKWIMDQVPDCASPVDLEEQWDLWMLKQKRIVFRPGAVYLEHVARLRAELLLYPELSGIRVPGREKKPLTPRDLLECRGQERLSEAVRLRADRLRTLAIGRSAEFLAVVEAYGLFFEALPTTVKEDELAALLVQAEKALVRLEDDVRTRANAPALLGER